MGQGFKPSQQLSYIPILVEVPLPPTPGDMHEMLQRLATLGAGVASSGQAIRQCRNEQESGPELTFAKTFGAVTMGQGGGGGIWPNGCPCYVALAFKF